MASVRRLLIRAAASSIVGLLLAELCLRVAVPMGFWQRPVPGWPWLFLDASMGWANRPGAPAGAGSINSLGFLGSEVKTARRDGSTRLVCMGDSGTFGFWVSRLPTDTGDNASSVHMDGYPDHLRKELARSGRADIEVINAGVIGYTTSHGLRQLVMKVLPLEPGIIVVRYCYNDHAASWDPSLRVAEPASWLGRSLVCASSHLRVGQLLLLAYRSMSFLHPRPWSVPWVTKEEYERNLQRFVEVCRAHGVRLLLVDYPIRRLTTESALDRRMCRAAGAPSLKQLHQDHGEYHAILERVALATGTPLVESRGVFEVSPEPCFSDADLVHPNSHGAEVLARLIHTRLAGLGWIGGR